MDFLQLGLSQEQVYAWIILPIIIFFARICDVTFGTMRIILVARGKRNIAPFLGFIEVLIWIVAIGQLVQHVQSITAYLGYAAGFATGNFIGMYLEEKIAIGTVIVRIILPQGGAELVTALRDHGFGVTSYNGEGANGPVKLIFTIVARKSLDTIKALIHQHHPMAFISIEDIRSIEAGVFPAMTPMFGESFGLRKGK